jgi:hypothetical protein
MVLTLGKAATARQAAGIPSAAAGFVNEANPVIGLGGVSCAVPRPGPATRSAALALEEALDARAGIGAEHGADEAATLVLEVAVEVWQAGVVDE